MAPTDARMRPWYAFIRVLANAVLRILLVREVRGLERVPKSGALIVASNHGSFWDPPVLGATLERELAYVAKKELFEVPLFGSFIRSLGAFPIRRSTIDRAGFGHAFGVLERGGALLIFPEGGRMKDGLLHPARPGLGLLTAQARVPIVPVYVSGTNHIRRCTLRLERVRVVVGEPLPMTTWSEDGTFTTRTGRDLHQAIGDRVMQEIALLKRELEETTRSGDAPATTTSQRADSHEQGGST